MRINSQKIIRLLEELAPPTLAESWDAVGFQLGNRDVAIGKVMVALEVTEAVAAEAEEKSVDLLVVHHPLLFRPVAGITEHDSLGRILRRLIRADIHVYAAHTNLDSALGGVNDVLAGLLNLGTVEVLRPAEGQPGGLGRMGRLESPMTLRELANAVKAALNAPGVRFVGPEDQKLRKAALCGGAGAELMAEARRQGCDVLITGDVKYHEARTAEALGLALIDGGHFETEIGAVGHLARWLRERADEKGYEVTVIESETLGNPYHYL